MNFDIIIVGASLGGVRAAISSAKCNKKVLLTEETDWIGGQLTSQAVPPDEHKWIENQGATKSYLAYRKKVREYYLKKPNFSSEIKATGKPFCPGGSWVSRIAHEPKVAQGILQDELNEYIKNGLVTLLLNTVAIFSVKENDEIKSITFKNLVTNEQSTYSAKYYLDGTDCGDLLPMTKTEFSMGAESKKETGEPHAMDSKNENDLQPITWVIALKLKDKLDKSDYIKKPKNYDYFNSKKTYLGDCKLFSWQTYDCNKNQVVTYGMFNNSPNATVRLGLWEYRRVVAQKNYTTKVDEVSLINWPQNDYDDGSVYGVHNANYHREMAKEMSMCFAYYLQNEAPNGDKKGYPVALCGDVVGTRDGLAKSPYIRESRRIVGKELIREQDVACEYNKWIKEYKNSVGVGSYPIDLHQTIVTHSTFFEKTYPFEIPLGALIPIKTKNLIPSCKNISCTHLTNGCYRLHPVEWNVGEVAGLLASFCIDKNCSLNDVDEKYYDEFKELMIKNGIQLHWNTKDMEL